MDSVLVEIIISFAGNAFESRRKLAKIIEGMQKGNTFAIFVEIIPLFANFTSRMGRVNLTKQNGG